MEPTFRGYDFYGVSTWKIDCGIAKFWEHLADELTTKNFPKDMGSLAVAPINGGAKDAYHTPAVNDYVIEQKNPKSWIKVGKRMAKQIAKRYRRGYASVVILQQDFGLDSDWENGSNSYADLADTVREEAEKLSVPDDYLFIVSYLHTVKEKIKKKKWERLQRRGLKRVADASDASIVMIPRAKRMCRDNYGIEGKIYHIDHGIRRLDVTEHDRKKLKKEMGLEDTVISLSMGFQGPNKGLDKAFEAYAELVNKSFTKGAREKSVYLVVGDCHKNLGGDHEAYQRGLRKKLDKLGLIWGDAHYEVDGKKLVIRDSNSEEVKKSGDPRKCDVVFVREIVSEKNYKRYLAVSNINVLAYPDETQTSSGIITDAIGAGRVVLTTSFEHPLYLLASKGTNRDDILRELNRTGTYGLNDPDSPGVIANIRKDYVKYLALGWHCLIEDKELRLKKEAAARQIRRNKYWYNVARDLIGCVRHLRKEKEERKGSGRGPEIRLKQSSPYAKRLKIIRKK